MSPFGIFILIGVVHPAVYFEDLNGVPHTTMATTYFSDSEESVTVYYVGGENASDSNPGTASLPFATIQKAASLAVEGDVVNIRTGTYRETILPANSGTPGNPIVFQPDGEAIVTISGADVADGGWMEHSGGIYKKTITMQSGYNASMVNNTTLMANQVFVNEKMMIEARWPNISNNEDLFNRADLRPTSNATWSESGAQTITDAGIPNILGGWTGGTIWVNGWYISQTKSITAHSGTQITISGTIPENKRAFYYLTGRLGALDMETEWHYDNSNTTLYLRVPDSGIPTNVEVKKRNYAFDLSGRSNITIRKIKLFAATIITTTNSTNIILDELNARYINHAVTLVDGDVIYSHTGQVSGAAGATGIRLMGANSIIQNSVIAYSSSMGIMLGENCIANNNLVHDIDYEGSYCSAIAPANGYNGQKITWNTIYRVGRSCVDILNSQNVEIGYNNMYDFGFLNNDLGATYAARNSNTTGLRIHHNWIHDCRAVDGMGINTGIYFDQNAGPSQIDHNVVWNTNPGEKVGDMYVQHTTYNSITRKHQHHIFNNTFATLSIPYSYKNSNNSFPDVLDLMKNNIFSDEFQITYINQSPAGTNSLYQFQDPKFDGTGACGLKYRLSSGSPAIDAGAVIAGITDGFAGVAPDIGAYEFGGTEWIPGSGDSIVPITYYFSIQVEFVDSFSGIPVEGLKVGIQGIERLTNNQGIISVPEIPKANYKLELLDNRFKIVGKDIIEVRSDSLFRVFVKKLPVYSIQIEFVDYINGEPLQGLVVTLNNLNYLSNNLGIISIPELSQGSHKIVLPDSRFEMKSDDTINVYSDSLFNISVLVKPHLILKVINRTTGISIYRAVVAVDGQSYTTNTSGLINFGDYSFESLVFSATHNDYFTMEDTLIFTRDTTIILQMTPKRANVTMQIFDLSGPLSTVKVTLAGTQYTNSNGNVFFSLLPARQNYSYSVERAGYNPVHGAFYLESDTSLVILIDRLTSVHNNNNLEIKLSPNPFDSHININIRENSLLYVYDVSGKLRNTVFLERGMNTILTGDLENGGYIFKIIEGLLVYNKLMFK